MNVFFFVKLSRFVTIDLHVLCVYQPDLFISIIQVHIHPLWRQKTPKSMVMTVYYFRNIIQVHIHRLEGLGGAARSTVPIANCPNSQKTFFWQKLQKSFAPTEARIIWSAQRRSRRRAYRTVPIVSFKNHENAFFKKNVPFSKKTRKMCRPVPKRGRPGEGQIPPYL